jgi:hypothetical protein
MSIEINELIIQTSLIQGSRYNGASDDQIQISESDLIELKKEIFKECRELFYEMMTEQKAR